MQNLWKGIRLQLILLLGTLAVGLLICEIYCRLALSPMRYGFPSGMYVQDSNPLLGFRMNENFKGEVATTAFNYSIQTNNLGFRSNTPIDTSKQLIGVFGDSFAFGQGVDEQYTFSSVLSDKISENYAVLNTGVCSYKPMQEYQVYKDLIDRGLNFGWIILQLYINDITIQESPVTQKVIDGKIYQDEPMPGFIGGIKSFLFRNSEFFLRLYTFKLGLEGKTSSNLKYVKKDFEVEHQSQISSTIALLGEWKKDATAKGSEFMVFFIPDRIQVEPYWVEKLTSEGYDVDAPQKWLENWAERDSAVTYLNMVSPFRDQYQNNTNTMLYFELNGHCNEAGHQKIASILADHF